MDIRPKAIVFDFDGVLVESVSVKGQAFYDLYQDRGAAIQQQVLEYHLRHGGVPRQEKIVYFQTQLLGLKADEAEINRLCEEFSRLVVEKVVAADWVIGAKEFIKEHHETLTLYVASATPQAELTGIIKKRDMDLYFKDVFGSPLSKEVHLTNIAKIHDLDPQEILMVGDTINDYNAAHKVGTMFIGRTAPGSVRDFPDDVPTLKDLVPLAQLIGLA